MKKASRFFLLALCLIGLILVRALEDVLFYDPYLAFFKNDYLYIDSPRREIVKLVASTSFRYLLNTLLSIGILYAVFKDKGVIKFSAIIFGLAYAILLTAYMFFVINPRQEDYYIFFNIRRFLIQPILLILLLPAFYYDKIKR